MSLVDMLKYVKPCVINDAVKFKNFVVSWEMAVIIDVVMLLSTFRKPLQQSQKNLGYW